VIRVPDWAVLTALSVACLGACSTAQRRSPASAPQVGNGLFAPVATVLTHPRCLNCHTVTDYPRQGNDRHRHLFLVARGPDDRGAVGKRCSECHQAQNQGNGVPGAPNWAVAPLAMAWESEPGRALATASLCRRLLDQSRNGNRDLPKLEEHMETERLVLWAWAPGNDLSGVPRRPPPISHEQFMQAFRAWEAAGAPCPSE
jgi:hypothetical protein